MPSWKQIQPEILAQIVQAATGYLENYRVASTSWIDESEVWFTVICGYWALRLLCQIAPDALGRLNDDVWYAWMPSVLGNRDGPSDILHPMILKVAYQRAPARFRELLSRFIEAQNKQLGDVPVLNRAVPVWDVEIADLVRTKLIDSGLAPRAFRTVLGALLDAGDEAALKMATDLVGATSSASADHLDRVIQATVELLSRDSSRHWRLVWPILLANPGMATQVFGYFGRDPYSSDTSRFLRGLSEQGLVELRIWLSEHEAMLAGDESPTHGAAQIDSAGDWRWLSSVVVSVLIERGTADAVRAIRQIYDKAPDERLKRVEHAAQEIVWQKTWMPLSPADLLSLVAKHPLDHPVEKRPERRAVVGGSAGKKASSDGSLMKVKSRIRQLRKDRYTYAEICDDLGKAVRPPNAGWRTLSWPDAFKDPTYKAAVKSWISRA
ncbi:MAG TPA: hypothetical protein VGN17_02775 [Bryobacteraceae bacterium]